MEQVIRECFILVQLTRGLALAISENNQKAVKRLIADRQICLDSISELRKKSGGRFDDEIETRIKTIGKEVISLEKDNIAQMRKMLAGLKIQEKDLHGSMRQLAQMKTGYLPKRKKPQIMVHYC